MWEELAEWDLALRYCADRPGNGQTEMTAKSLFFRGNYEACFKELNKNISLLNNEKYVVMALCCILMERKIQSASISDLIVKVKRNEFIKPLYAYNFFAYNQDIKCDKDSIMEFCTLLLKTADPDCIKYVRLALDHIKDMNFKELAKISYENGLYYFSEEIINLYGREHKNDYDILCLLAGICYYTGNIGECEKYISNALVINESKELVKLACLCKLKECSSIIARYKSVKNVKSIKSFMERIEECEKLLVP
jgi:hypothetical protein